MKRLSLMLALYLMLSASASQAGEHAVSTYMETSPVMHMKITWQRFGLPLPDKESDALVGQAITDFRAMAEEEQATRRELQTEPEDACPYVCEMILEGSLEETTA